MKYILIGFGVLVLLLLVGIVAFLAYRYYENRNVKDTKNLEEIIEKVGTSFVSNEGNVGLVIVVVKGEKQGICRVAR